MILKTLRLHNFRNYEDETISFGPNLNIIIGGNAQGKTNLLEAIYLLSIGRSFKAAHLKELIMQGKSYFQIEAEIVKDLVAQTIKIYFDDHQKKVLHNSNPLPSFTSLLGILPSVMHAPSDIELISGQPSVRRRFLNLLLAQHDPLYVHHLSRYFRALKQRNFLLKTQNLSSIEVWEDEMAKSASYLIIKRDKAVAQLSAPINQIMKTLSNMGEEIILRYMPGMVSTGELNTTYNSYLKQLEKNRPKDLLLKNTLFGPHRDDFICYLDKKAAKIYASEGQKRCLISSLRLAEYNLLSNRLQFPAIMNIDDIGIHLDEERQKKMKAYLNNLNQIFITLPTNEKIWHESATFIKIANGKRVVAEN
jgi:DNA replication and repair protein RecF